MHIYRIEIWPNVIRNIKKQKLPLILLNARIKQII